jgi:tRNA pseudouridine55 synthase
LTNNSPEINPADNSIFLVNKPPTWSSFDVVNKLRGSLRVKKMGHAGTLDPLAVGLLIVCTGSKTKIISEIQDAEKEYTGTIMLGATTPSYDLETAVDQTFSIEHITDGAIQKAAEYFTGEIEQLPPAHSAVKIGGKRAYKLARQGKAPVMPPRRVHIREFEVTDIQLPEVNFRIVCSKGTYVRSLAYDFGKKLGSGGYLKYLCRTRIGEHSLAQAKTIDEWITEFHK